eukprot:8348858-Pyramimonas_sp.AAC.1
MGHGAPGSERQPIGKGAPGPTSSPTPGETRYSTATISSRHGANWDTTPTGWTENTSSTSTGQAAWRSSADSRSATP